ncbi:Nitrogen assimilation regulatory protein [compost metagenome]
MDENKSKILILEDDVSLGTALKEILSRDGHHVHLVSRPDEASTIIASQQIDFVFCDCLLPQMTGVDFLEGVRTSFPKAKFKTILMSGIYTDKQFVQEATQRTQAIAFLKKPFEITEVLKLVKNESTPREEFNARKLLYGMFANPKVTPRQKRKVIESIEEISGFDLPFVYSLLVETKSSGYLNIYNSDGSVSGISFCNGNIVSVDVDDRTTFLGEMLIQSGYSTPEDVQAALRDKNNRRIGNYLIQNNQLSPHAFDLILMEQMNIRLVRTIVDEKIRINFATAEVEMSSPSIDSETLLMYLHDWIASKLSITWLKTLYRMWAGNVIVKNAAFTDDAQATEMSLVQSLEGFVQKLDNRMTLNQILDIKGYNEVAVYKAIHFLLTRGLIVFADKKSFATEQEQLQTLKKIWVEIQDKNSFDMLTYIETGAMSSNDSVGAQEEFLSLLGDQPKDPQSEVYKLWEKMKQMAVEAVATTNDTQRINQYKQATQRSEAEAKVRAATLMEEVKKSLMMNQYANASQNLTEIAKLYPQMPQLHIYSSWQKLGMMDPAKKQFILKDVELEILQVPADERYDVLFSFVIGLFNKGKGDLGGARKSFEKSLALDPSFMPARRELSLLSASSKKQDVFTMDLKEMVSGFFKRK